MKDKTFWKTPLGRVLGAIVGIAILLPLVLLLAPFLLLFWSVMAAVTIGLYLAIWAIWLPRGRRVLFVYSNSPNWQAYVEEKIIPRLPSKSAILNYSERSKWPRFTLS